MFVDRLHRALLQPKFQVLVLATAGLPLLVDHLITTVPLRDLASTNLNDFWVYMSAAADLRHGRDPYSTFFASTVNDVSVNQGYIYPPLLAWLLQPAVGVPRKMLVAGVVLVLQAAILLWVELTARLLGAKGFKVRAALLVLAIGFLPVRSGLYGGSVTLLLLPLTALWTLGYVRGAKWWSAAALGAAGALKPIVFPYALLLLQARRWSMIAVSATVGLTLWILALPSLLPEYWVRVFPAVARGTGFRENQSLAAAVERLVHPFTLYGQLGPISDASKVAALAGAAFACAITLWALHTSRSRGSDARRLETAAVISMSPLLATLVWPNHLALSLTPIAVVAAIGLRHRRPGIVLMAATAWLLLGPVSSALLTAVAVGLSDQVLLRPLAEGGFIGCVLLWAAAIALTRMPLGDSAPDLIPAHEHVQGLVQARPLAGVRVALREQDLAARSDREKTRLLPGIAPQPALDVAAEG